MATLLLLLASCGPGRYIPVNTPEKQFDAEQVLYETRPELVPYYEAHVLKITNMREIKDKAGNTRYELDYKFTRYYIRDLNERLQILKEKFPEMYDMYVNGYIELHNMYRFVDNEGNIRYTVNYFRVYDYYYYYVPFMRPYGGYRYDYAPRPMPRVSPRPPAPRPNGGGPHPQGPKPQRPPRRR